MARAEIGRKWRPKPWTVQLQPSSGRIGQVFITPAIGRFPRFGESHIFGLRSQNLERGVGLSWLRENGKMPFVHKLYSLLVIKVVI